MKCYQPSYSYNCATSPFIATIVLPAILIPPLFSQQHGSVYWKNGAGEVLQSLDSSKTLYQQLKVKGSKHYVEHTPPEQHGVGVS